MDAALRSMSQPKGVVALTADSTTFIGGEDVPSSVELRWRPGEHQADAVDADTDTDTDTDTEGHDAAGLGEVHPVDHQRHHIQPGHIHTAKSSASAVSVIATNFRETADLLVAEALTIALGRDEGAYEEQLEAALATQRAEPRSSKSSG